MNWNPTEHYKSQKVAKEYDAKRFSSIAGRVFNYLEKRTIVKCFARLPRGSVIIDAPCGTGRLADPLLAAGYHVHGLDISAAMLDVARDRLAKYGERFTCEVEDVTQLHTRRRKYDGVLCARILMHFPLDKQIEFLSGAAKLSQSIVVINQSLNSPYQRFRRHVKHWLGNQESAGYPISDAEMRTLLERSGLREIARFRQLRLISEAIYIVATRVDEDSMNFKKVQPSVQ